MLLLKLSMRPWRLAPFSQLFSSMAVGLLLLLVGLLFWIENGLKPIVGRLRHEQVITAFLDPSVEPQDEGALVDSIRTALGAHSITPEGNDVGFVDTQAALGLVKDSYPELGRELEELGTEARTVVPRYVTASGVFADAALARVREIRGVESAESSKDRYRHVVAAFSALRWVAKLLMVGLGMALLTGLIQLSRMNAFFHREVVSLMRLWGTGESLLQLPHLLSGILVGMVGGALAGLGWLVAASWFGRHIRALSPMLRGLGQLPSWFPLVLLGVGILVGLVAGLLGGSSGGLSPVSERRS